LDLEREKGWALGLEKVMVLVKENGWVLGLELAWEARWKM
jgi:hypothetical protein